MSRNNSELLLRMLHFSNNKKVGIFNRLYKIKPIIENIEIIKKYYDPSENICIVINL